MLGTEHVNNENAETEI